MELEQLFHTAQLWRAGQKQQIEQCSLSTGIQSLDELLMGNGWPTGALTEIITAPEASSTLQLLMPAITQLSQQGRWLAMVAPPFLPNAPALAAQGADLSRILLIHPKPNQTLWALEQALRSGTCGAVIGWPPQLDDRSLRRLQLAAEQGQAAGFIFRNENLSTQSPAALRLKLENTSHGLRIHVLKRRGGWPTEPITVSYETLHDFPTAA